MSPESEAIIRAVIARMEGNGMGSWKEVTMLRKALPAEADSAYAEENADIEESRRRKERQALADKVQGLARAYAKAHVILSHSFTEANHAATRDAWDALRAAIKELVRGAP